MQVTTTTLSCQVSITFHSKLVSEANISEHWTKRGKRAKGQRNLVKTLLLEKKPSGSIPLPCLVILTRYSKRKYDDDNLMAAFKHVRDSVADFIRPGLAPGQADNDECIKWQYDQKSCGSQPAMIRIEIYS